jgi:hypothetical protein
MLRSRQHIRILFLMTVLLIKLLTVSAAKGSDSFPLQRFLDLEIQGISLSTLPEDIPVILEAAGYFQSGNSTFIRDTPLPGGRKSIYRIELEDTPEHRSITYFRGESGGRNKSSVERNRPVPDNEAVWARAIYELVCLHVPDAISKARACQPVVGWEIRFGEGSFLSISDNAGAQVDAAGASTTLGVTYFKK